MVNTTKNSTSKGTSTDGNDKKMAASTNTQGRRANVPPKADHHKKEKNAGDAESDEMVYLQLKFNTAKTVVPLLKKIGVEFSSKEHRYTFADPNNPRTYRSSESEKDVQQFFLQYGIPRLATLEPEEQKLLHIWTSYAHVNIKDIVDKDAEQRDFLDDDTALSLLQDRLKLIEMASSNPVAGETSFKSTASGVRLGNLQDVRCCIRALGLDGLSSADPRKTVEFLGGIPTQSASTITTLSSKIARPKRTKATEAELADLRLWAARAPFRIQNYPWLADAAGQEDRPEWLPLVFEQTNEDMDGDRAAGHSASSTGNVVTPPLAAGLDMNAVDHPRPSDTLTVEGDTVPQVSNKKRAAEPTNTTRTVIANSKNTDNRNDLSGPEMMRPTKMPRPFIRLGEAPDSSAASMAPLGAIENEPPEQHLETDLPKQQAMTIPSTKEKLRAMTNEELRLKIQAIKQQRASMVHEATVLHMWAQENLPRQMTEDILQNANQLDSKNRSQLDLIIQTFKSRKEERLQLEAEMKDIGNWYLEMETLEDEEEEEEEIAQG